MSFSPLDISLGYSSPSQISRSEGLNDFTVRAHCPSVLHSPRALGGATLLSVPTALTPSDVIIVIYFCSFNGHIIVP